MNAAFRFLKGELTVSDRKSRTSVGARRNPETEQAVLAAAEAILAEDGFAALTMEAVARRARAGKATLYRWWPSRGHLLIALYERRKADFALPDTGRLETDIEALLGRLFGFWSQPGGRLFGLIVAEAQHSADMAEALAEFRSDRHAHLRRIFQRAEERGELAPGVDTDLAIDVTISVAWMHMLTDRLDADCAALARTLCCNWCPADASAGTGPRHAAVTGAN